MKLVIRMMAMSNKDNLTVADIMDTLYKKNFGKKMFLFVMGMLISAMSFNLFFEPYDVIPTGSGGLSFLIADVFQLDVSLVTLIVSLVLLLVGLIFFGFDYALKILACTLIYPFF